LVLTDAISKPKNQSGRRSSTEEASVIARTQREHKNNCRIGRSGQGQRRMKKKRKIQ